MHFLSLRTMKKSLKKAERLYKRDSITLLFRHGKKGGVSPIRIIYRYVPQVEREDTICLKAAWSVPKRNFKKAVDRNAIKRKMKEAYRLHKTPLQEALIKENKCLHLIFIYNSKEKVSYKKIEDKIILILQRLQGIK